MKKAILLLLGISFLLSSCSLFQAPKFVKVNDVKLLDLTADQTLLDMSIIISNPNWFGIGIKTMKVIVMDKNRDKLGEINLTKPLHISKNATDTVYFQIALETRRVTKLISHEASNVNMVIRAEAVAQAIGVTKKINIEQKQSINFTEIFQRLLPQIPSDIRIPTIQANVKKGKGKDKKLVMQKTDIVPAQAAPTKLELFKVIKTSITDVGFKETELTVKFIMLNPFGVAFTLIDFPAEVYINDKYAGKGTLQKPIKFSEDVVNNDGALVFKLNNLNTMLTGGKALLKKDMNYRVEGTLKAAGFGTTIEKAFRFTGTVDMDGKPEK